MAYTRQVTNISPYWDDFASYRNFMRILFNPSRAVQARELTQLQTLGQNQLEKMANHIFKDGSSVIGAKVEVTDLSPYIEILATNVVEKGTSTQISNVQDLVGQRIQAWTADVNSPTGSLAKILAVDNNAGTLRLQLDYHGGEFAVADKFVCVNYADDDATAFPTKYQSQNAHISAVGSGLRARVDSGTVWINGFFVEIQEQEIFVTKAGTTGTFVIGYEFEEITLEATNTTELDPLDGVTILGNTIRDPAGSSNNGAPGADRYMIKLWLKSYEVGVDTIPVNFHQVIKITDNVVEEKVEKTSYADILDLLAGRTYDESGSYTVEPYSLLASTLDANNFNYEIGPGLSYVFGYERENVSPVKLAASKTRTFRSRTGESNPAQYGTYIVCRDAPAARTFDDVDVNNSTEVITIPEHGYGLGDRLTFTQGSGAITGLTNGVDYYVIPVDKDSFKLATSPTNATAGTAQGLTGAAQTGHTLTGAEQKFEWFDATALQVGYLMSGYSGTGTVIGSARVYFINDINGQTRLYLGDNPELLADLAQAKSICEVDTGNPSATLNAYMNIGSYSYVGNNQPIVPLIGSFVKQVTGVNYPTLIKIANKAVTAGVSFSLATGDANDVFQGGTDPESAIAYLVTDGRDVIDHNSPAIKVFGTNPTGGGTATITSDTDHNLATDNYDFYMLINRSSATVRTKTLTAPATFDLVFGGSAQTTVILNGSTNGGLSSPAATYYDVAAIESIVRDPAGVAEDVTNLFTFDDGQKDLYYDYASITGPFANSQTYRVKLHHWAWGGAGDFFAANSYAKGTDTWFDDKGGYEANIPTFTNDNKTKTYTLRDCLDFRRNITEISTAKEIIEPTGSAIVTYEFYLPRWDKIWIDRTGRFGVTEGIAEERPSIPPDQSGTMSLFTAYVRPYIYNPVGSDTNISSDQINIRMIDKKNYTMDDIRKLEKRLQNLEAYTSESQLELDSYADTVVDVNGLPRSKNGIFVDRFNNHTKGSVWESGYRCSMDPLEGKLHCPFEMNQVKFEYDSTPAASGVQTNVSEETDPWTNTITLDYTSTLWIEQPLASEFMNINPFAVIVWAGEIILNPASDTWHETQYVPALQIQDPDEAAKIRALYERPEAGIPQWGAWTSQVIGIETNRVTSPAPSWPGGTRTVVEDVITTTTQTTRTGTVLEQTGTQMVFREMGERVVDISQLPWMRVISIEFEAFGLRPDTTMIPYFANVDISANVVWDGATPAGKTNKAGYLKGVFTVPEKTFRTGKNTFTLKDSTFNPLSLASTEFRAEGTLFTRQKEILSVEVPTYGTRAIFESELSTTTEENFVRWVDPIAQTILVEDAGGVFLESIDIFFATKDRYLPVSLYIVETIAGVPGQKRVPFSLVTKNADDIVATYWDENASAGEELRYRGNHYSTQGTVLVHADGTEVTSPATPTDFTPTNFAFSDPVYLKEGVEYAFVLVSNSNNYNVYVSRMGSLDIISGAGINKQPHLGSLLKSQNTSTWTPDQYADIKFKINRCDFDNSSSALYMRVQGEVEYWDDIVYVPGEQVIFDHTTDGLNVYECIEATTLGSGHDPEAFPAKWTYVRPGYYDATLLNISMDDLIIPGTSIVRQYLSDPNVTWLNFTNKENIVITSKDTVELYTDGAAQNPTSPKGINLKLQLQSDSTWHSPVINKERSFAVLVNNLVTTPEADAPTPTPTWDAGEYISDTVQLKDNASTLKLLIDVARPNTGAIIVPKYRTMKEEIRYVAHDPAIAGDENLLSLQTALKDELCYVYHLDDNFTADGAVVTGWLQKDTVIVDGLDATNNRVYLSSVADPGNFKVDGSLPGTNPWIVITSEPDILAADVFMWNGTKTDHGVGDYVFDADKNLYRCEVANTMAPPSLNSIDWTFIPMVLVDGTIQFDTESEWRPMEQINTINEAVDTTNFVEYEYEPLITPSEEFNNFAVKIEMYSSDEVHVPECKRLRVIAVN